MPNARKIRSLWEVEFLRKIIPLALVLALALAVVAPTAIAQVDQTSDQSSEAGEIGQEFDISREGGIE